MKHPKKNIDEDKIDWDFQIEKWCKRMETDIFFYKGDQDPLLVCFRLIKKKLDLPVNSGKRGWSNPNPGEVLWTIFETYDFYHRNIHRFEFLQAGYLVRNYGCEVYLHSTKAPEIINREIIVKNRIKVCRRMITMISNKKSQFEEEQNKSLFPNWEHSAYKKFIQKLSSYSNELKLLESELNNFKNQHKNEDSTIFIETINQIIATKF